MIAIIIIPMSSTINKADSTASSQQEEEKNCPTAEWSIKKRRKVFATFFAAFTALGYEDNSRYLPQPTNID
jgi:hypothetical protein